ncbi:MAG: type 1 glutamine amidotransferase domain-containing protein [Steroidobacteraceae bacterium]
MAKRLEGKSVAILATDGFEEVELTQPLDALRAEGAQVDVVAPKAGEIQGFNHFDRGRWVPVDVALDDADASDYDAIVLPGGAHNPDQLRINEKALTFVRAFADAGKPVAAICHAPWILINAGLAAGRKLTSWTTIREDLKNAGATVVDEEVVVDAGLVTSRGPKDLPAFCNKVIEEITEGLHHQQAAKAKHSEPRPRH